jgi:hypothetical protein
MDEIEATALVGPPGVDLPGPPFIRLTIQGLGFDHQPRCADCDAELEGLEEHFHD